jgi:hypothetical protein
MKTFIKNHKEVNLMADAVRNIALAILGIVAVLAIAGLVLMFKGGSSATGNAAYHGEFGVLVSEPVYCTDADYLRGRCVLGSAARTGTGPRYQLGSGGTSYGNYPAARYSGIVSGGNPYLEAYAPE